MLLVIPRVLPRVYVMRGSTNPQSLMCSWRCVAELLSDNRQKCHFQYLACLKWRTLSDKISSDKIFDGQNISSDKIFDTKPKFRHFCPIFAWLLYWNIGQNFRRTKFFVGQNFRHQAEISTILSDEFLSDKVCYWQSNIVDEIGIVSDINFFVLH